MRPTRVIAYSRVSTEKQAERGQSLGAQRTKLAAYAVAMDLEIVESIEDAGQSAKTLDRPGLQRALAALRAGRADAILVCKLDRLTRSVRDLGTLVEEYFAGDRWALLSTGDSIDTRSAAGRLVLNVLASVSQWEREAISERTKDALAAKKARGERIGGCPFGYAADTAGHLAIDPNEQRVIDRVIALRAEGLSGRAIVARLATEGLKSRRGTPLALTQIQRILRNNAHTPAMVASAA